MPTCSRLPFGVAPLVLAAMSCRGAEVLPKGAAVQPPDTFAIAAGRIYTAPDVTPIDDGIVIVKAGKLAYVGDRQHAPASPTPSLAARVVTAGFWNCHVHFTEPMWRGAGSRSAADLAAHLREMLTSHGFVGIVDTGSNLENTAALRRRIESGEIAGPTIRTAGGPLYPKDGIPYYLRDSLEPDEVTKLFQPATPREATNVVDRDVAGGADIVKLFTGSWVERGRVQQMLPEIAAAAVAEAHRQRRQVFAHASNLRGLEIALDAGVDVIAHALDDDRGLTAAHFARMRVSHTAMIPTLKLFDGAPYTHFIVDEVRNFASSGGEILFGTDVGFLTDHDPNSEFVLLSSAGLGTTEILAALTTAPAARFGTATRHGRLIAGEDADLVVLGADPARDPRAFADVRLAMRAGKILYAEETVH